VLIQWDASPYKESGREIASRKMPDGYEYAWKARTCLKSMNMPEEHEYA